jgi:DNA helicase II / ATP-dependent DNA helicase PcrA
MIQVFRSKLPYISLQELMSDVIEKTGYIESLEAADEEEAKGRIDNIDELISKVAIYEQSTDEPTLSGFLEEVALVADIDKVTESDNKVLLMTLHSAKGLEFSHVYLTGMEDGLFPGYASITAEDPMELEEERRLCYVGITRAKDDLTLTYARQRMLRGETQYNAVSRFVREIPQELMDARAPVHKQREEDIPNPFSFADAKKSFRAKPFVGAKDFGGGSGELDYGVGDTVRHIKFGEGVVKQIVNGGRDYEVTVDFTSAGVKKMFAAFAKLQKV